MSTALSRREAIAWLPAHVFSGGAGGGPADAVLLILACCPFSRTPAIDFVTSRACARWRLLRHELEAEEDLEPGQQSPPPRRGADGWFGRRACDPSTATAAPWR